MRILVAYYSRTGNSHKAAQIIAKRLNAQLYKIDDLYNRKGPIGYIKTYWEALRKKYPYVKECRRKLRECDLVVLCGPIWVKRLATPIYSFVEDNCNKLKKLAYFMTCKEDLPYNYDVVKMNMMIGYEGECTYMQSNKEGQELLEDAVKFAEAVKKDLGLPSTEDLEETSSKEAVKDEK